MGTTTKIPTNRTAIDRAILRRTTTVATRKHDTQESRKACDTAFRMACEELYVDHKVVHSWAQMFSRRIKAWYRLGEKTCTARQNWSLVI